MINIIGGGISGLATALTLQKNGVDFNLFEKDSEITYGNVGLGISYNIQPILKEWDILEETKRMGAEIFRLHFVDYKLNYLKSFRLNHPALCVNRKNFHRLLYQQLNSNKVFFNTMKSVNDFDPNEIVISADGIQSKFRQELYPKLKLRNADQILWRGISEIKLEEKFKNAYHDFIGNNLRFAIIHTGDNYYSWYIIRPKKSYEDKHLNKSILKSYFDGYNPIIQAVIEQTESIYTSELMDINPKKRKGLRWFNENSLMIGDAIHPTTPNMANGACLAMEDAYLIANMLSENSVSIRSIYESFQSNRTSKVDRIIAQSWLFGKLFHQRYCVIDKIVKTGITLMPDFLFNSMYSSLLKQ